MNFFGIEINKADSIRNLKNKINKLEEQVTTNRPQMDYMSMQANRIHVPYFPVKLQYLYDLANYSDVVSTVFDALRGEIFRREIEINPIKKEDDTYNHTHFPLESEKEIFLKFYHKANLNNQSLIEVFEQLEDDGNTVNDQYMLFNRKYAFDENGEIIASELKEILRIDPVYTEPVINNQGIPGKDENNKDIFVCPIHRTNLLYEEKCPICNRKTYPAFYKYDFVGDKSYKFYLESEIIHAQRYKKKIGKSFPPLLSVWKKVETLMAQDQYINQRYTNQRPTKGMVVLNTSNRESARKEWEKMRDNVKENPHTIPVLAVENQGKAGKVAEFIDFMNSNLAEMQFIEGREEMRRTIGARYGVMPIFQGDLSQAGGLNNEGLQVTVTNRASERGQKHYNTKFIPVIKKELHITDWEIKLPPSEEQDEMSEIQRESLKIQNAERMNNMGFDVKLNKSGDFEFSGEAKASGFASFPENPESQETEQTGSPAIKANPSPDVSKIAEQFKDELDDELKKLLKKIDFKKGMQSKEMKEFMSKLSLKLGNKIKEETKKQMKLTYKDQMKAVSFDIGKKITMGKVDKETLNILMNKDVLNEAFSNLTVESSNRVNEKITKILSEPEGFSSKKIEESIRSEFEMSKSQAHNIARTETTKVSNAARINSYTKFDDGTKKYKWVGPDDSRTTGTCRRIQRRVGNGKPIKELIGIVREESNKDFPNFTVDEKAPAAHYQCRHVIVRAV